MLCASDWKHSYGPRQLLFAAQLSLTVAKNVVAPQADPSMLERVSMAKAGVIGVQMRAAHRPLAKTDQGVAKMHSTAVRADVKRLLGQS